MKTNNVTKMYPPNYSDKADNVLELSKGHCEKVLVVGYDKSGQLLIWCNTAMAEDQDLIISTLEKVKHNALCVDWSTVVD